MGRDERRSTCDAVRSCTSRIFLEFFIQNIILTNSSLHPEYLFENSFSSPRIALFTDEENQARGLSERYVEEILRAAALHSYVQFCAPSTLPNPFAIFLEIFPAIFLMGSDIRWVIRGDGSARVGQWGAAV